MNEIIARLLDEPGLLAVNGPPGTGKTTLLRDLVAAIVVTRAERIARVAKPGRGLQPGRAGAAARGGAVTPLNPALAGLEIVVASANNGAVENVTAADPRPGRHRRPVAGGRRPARLLHRDGPAGARGRAPGQWSPPGWATRPTAGRSPRSSGGARPDGRTAAWSTCSPGPRASRTTGPPPGSSSSPPRKRSRSSPPNGRRLPRPRPGFPPCGRTPRRRTNRSPGRRTRCARSRPSGWPPSARCAPPATGTRRRRRRSTRTRGQGRACATRCRTRLGARREWRARQAALDAELRDRAAAVSTAQRAIAVVQAEFAATVRARAESAARLRRLTAECAAAQEVIARGHQRWGEHLPEGPDFPARRPARSRATQTQTARPAGNWRPRGPTRSSPPRAPSCSSPRSPCTRRSSARRPAGSRGNLNALVDFLAGKGRPGRR